MTKGQLFNKVKEVQEGFAEQAIELDKRWDLIEARRLGWENRPLYIPAYSWDPKHLIHIILFVPRAFFEKDLFLK